MPQPTVPFVTQGSQLYIMNQTISPHTVVVNAALQGISGIGGQKSSIKITNFDSAGYDEYAAGLVDPGKPTGNIVLNFGDASHQLLKKLLGLGTGATTTFFYASGENSNPPTVVAGALIPPRTGTSPTWTYTRSGFLFNGFVAEFSISANVNNVIMAKLTIQATGNYLMYCTGTLGPF